MSETRVKIGGANGESTGPLVIVKPSELAETGVTGTVAKGIYEKKEVNKFEPSKNDYFLRDTETNTLYIVRSTKAIAEALEQPEVMGQKIEIVYNGKKPTKRGKGFHAFDVFLLK